MLSKLILSIIVGIVVTLVCVLVGTLLAGAVPGIAWVATLAGFLKTYGALFGLLAALWYFFSGANFFNKV